jgi:hypothetical protein
LVLVEVGREIKTVKQTTTFMSYFRTSAPGIAEFRPRRDTTTKWQRNQNTVAYVAPTRMGPITHTVIVALMVAMLGLVYLSQVTKSSTFGYTMQQQTDTLASLTAQQQDLEIENARLQALNTVKDSNVAKAMTVPVSTTTATN